jgi:iron complex transport system ATP-binding protein
MKMIEVKDLSFRYRKNSKNVLDNLSFAIEKGVVNVLIGLNGSGKTTLIKTLAGLFDNYIGEILLNGKNLREIKIKERAKIISYVAQRNTSVDDFLVREYLLFGRVNKLNFYSSPKKEDEEEMIKCAQRFNITHLLDKKLGEISGGERQIVSICSAIIQNTDVVILDEPTSALDIKNQHKVLSIIKEIASEQNKTFILSSHNPNHALFLDSKVMLLQNGKIAMSGDSKETIVKEKLSEVYGENICYSEELPYKEITFKA